MSDNVIIAVISGAAIVLAATITAFVTTLNKVREDVKVIKISIDGRMDELLETTKKLENAIGNKEGREQLTEENKKAK